MSFFSNEFDQIIIIIIIFFSNEEDFESTINFVVHGVSTTVDLVSYHIINKCHNHIQYGYTWPRMFC